MRVIEFIRSIPTLPLWLVLAALLPRDWSPLATYLAITAILSLLGWTWLARTVRSKLLATRHEDFVLAARLSGCSDGRIIRRHLLPSFMSYLIVDTSIAFPEILLAETSLSFLGLGLREPVESWGVLLFAAQSMRSIDQAPWLMIPGVFVIVAVLAFNFVGDGLRDAADPYSRCMMSAPPHHPSSSVREPLDRARQRRRLDRRIIEQSLVHDRQRRGAGAGRRERLGQERHRAVADAAARRRACRSSSGEILLNARDGFRADIAKLGTQRRGRSRRSAAAAWG